MRGESSLRRKPESRRRRWQLAHTPDDVASRGELNLLRRYALRLLNEAATPGAIDQLAEVTAAVKLRVSWKSQAMADALAGLDATSAVWLQLGILVLICWFICAKIEPAIRGAMMQAIAYFGQLPERLPASRLPRFSRGLGLRPSVPARMIAAVR